MQNGDVSSAADDDNDDDDDNNNDNDDNNNDDDNNNNKMFLYASVISCNAQLHNTVSQSDSHYFLEHFLSRLSFTVIVTGT